MTPSATVVPFSEILKYCVEVDTIPNKEEAHYERRQKTGDVFLRGENEQSEVEVLHAERAWEMAWRGVRRQVAFLCPINQNFKVFR